MVDTVLQTLIIRLKGEGAKKTKKQVDDVQASSKKSSQQMTKTSKKFGLAFKAAGLFAVGLFGAILKGGPATTQFLTEAWSAIGFLSDTILEGAGAWDLLQSLTDFIFDLNDAAQKAPEPLKDLAGALLIAGTAIGVVTVGTTALNLALKGLAINPVVLVIGGLVLALVLLDKWWKRNHDDQSIFTAALDGAEKAIEDLSFAIEEGKIPENWKTIWQKVREFQENHNKKVAELDTPLYAGLKTRLAQWKKDAKAKWAEIQDVVKKLWKDLTDEIIADAKRLKTDVLAQFDKLITAFKNLRKKLSTPIIITTIRKTITGAVKRLTGGGGSVIAGRQAGGPIQSGVSKLVGEGGPEIFTPSSSGRITPNNQIGGGFGGGDTVVRMEINLDSRRLWEGIKRVSGRDLKRLGG